MPIAHQSPSFTFLLNWTGERKYSERLLCQNKDKETSLIDFHPGKKGQNLFDWENKYNFFPIKSEQDNKK